MSKFLITSALPYVNGVKHLGNLAGSLLPADIHARFRRQTGHDVLFLCGTDEHGTPVELAAEIRKHIPAFEIRYEVDAVRQGIADSWPNSLDCSAAKAEWGFAPRFGLSAMVDDMLTKLRARIT